MRTLPPALVAASLLASSAVHPLELGVDLLAETEYTTNVGKSEDFEVRDWIIQPGVNLIALHDGPSLEMDVGYQFEHRFYWEDVYDDDNSATGHAGVIWRALPERLDFILDHVRTESSILATVTNTPDNRQHTSTTSAGPLLRFNPRGEDQIELQYEYIDRSAQRSATDSTSHRSSGRYVLVPSTTNSVTLEGIYNEVQFDDPGVPDLTYKVGQLTWMRTGVNTQLSLTGGYNETERTLGREDVTGPIGEATLTWQARPTTVLTLSASRIIDDQPPELQNGEFFDEQEFNVNSDLAEIFTGDLASATLTQDFGPRTILSLTASFETIDYEDVDRDTESTALDAVLTRRLPRQMQASFRLRGAHQIYLDQDDEVDTFRADLDLTWQATRRLELGVGVGYETSDSQNGLFARDYDEWIARATLTYSAVALREDDATDR